MGGLLNSQLVMRICRLGLRKEKRCQRYFKILLKNNEFLNRNQFSFLVLSDKKWFERQNKKLHLGYAV